MSKFTVVKNDDPADPGRPYYIGNSDYTDAEFTKLEAATVCAILNEAGEELYWGTITADYRWLMVEAIQALVPGLNDSAITVTPAPDAAPRPDAALVEALRPFAACAEVWEGDDPGWILHRSRSHWPGKPDLHITVGDLQRAAAALASVEQGGAK